MSTIDRYRKSGGFNQLLLLLETCGPQKQQKLLEIIAQEDSFWYEILRKKMLSIERILGWSDQIVLEIFSHQYDLTLGVFFHGQKPEVKNRIMKLLPKSRYIKIEDAYTTKAPNSGEIATMNMKIIEFTRQKIASREFKVSEFDPELDIPDNIEEKLNQKTKDNVSLPKADETAGVVMQIRPVTTESMQLQTPPTNRVGGDNSEILRKVQDLQKENATLKHELRIALGKLDQIRKIA